jgi:hypothetical protein
MRVGESLAEQAGIEPLKLRVHAFLKLEQPPCESSRGLVNIPHLADALGDKVGQRFRDQDHAPQAIVPSDLPLYVKKLKNRMAIDRVETVENNDPRTDFVDGDAESNGRAVRRLPHRAQTAREPNGTPLVEDVTGIEIQGRWINEAVT